MARRTLPASRLLAFCLLLTVFVCFYLALYPLQEASLCSNTKDVNDPLFGREGLAKIHDHTIVYKSNHTLAIVVPFRDRFEELMEFVPHMHKFLNKQGVRHKIFVINQIDNYRFNRASLINIGFLESSTTCDYIAMHDVDLLPLNHNLSYSFPKEGAFHIASPELHPLYHYRTFVGGILLLTGSDFRKLNGMSNRYWGWGREDDEFFVRMRKAGVLVHRPKGITTGNATFRHVHDRKRRPRDNKRYFDQKERTRRLDKETGVSTVQYDLVSKKDLLIDQAPVTIINVKLKCDLKLTPWCLQPEDHDWFMQQQQPLH